VSGENFFDRRRAGVLLHPTSLPDGGRSGDLGPGTFRFIDFLADAGFSVWQMLPLGPTHDDASPYHCLSVHAGNPALVSLRDLATRGWMDERMLTDPVTCTRSMRECLAAAARTFFDAASPADHAAFDAFCRAQAYWLDDFAQYEAIREAQQGRAWFQWPASLRDRHAESLLQAAQQFAARIDEIRFEQFAFATQWLAVREHARRRGVTLFGDMPFFVAHDSAEVWAHRDIFKLDDQGLPTEVAGVPPDYFSASGQRWGNPLYRWDALQENDFAWWTKRLTSALQRVDLLRIDHFRGLEACWEIPSGDATAANGKWVPVPGAELLASWQQRFGRLPLVAEDLGHITDAVRALRQRFALPGMLVLQFAFDSDSTNPYLPHNHTPDHVVYTGTHDNNTTLGWFMALPAAQQQRVRQYLGCPADEPMPWPLVRAALASVAVLAVVPMQDVLGLDASARMNIPGTSQDNWMWRFSWDQIEKDLPSRLRTLIDRYGRLTA